MVNHGRTLLLNRAGAANRWPEAWLSEYVDPEFAPVNWSWPLSAVRSAVLPAGCDYAYADYRMRLVTQAIHATEYAQRAAYADPRITYLAGRASAAAVRGGTGVERHSGAADLLVSGSVRNAGAVRLYPSWVVTAYTGRLAAVSDTGRTAEVSGSVADTLGPVLKLPGHPGLSVRTRSSGDPAGSSWRVTAFVPPERGMPGLLEDLEAADASAVGDLLFGQLPYAVYRDLWQNHPVTHYRIAGLMLAWFERADRFLRKGI